MTTDNAVALRDNAPKPQLRSGGQLSAIVPTDADQAFRMAQMIAQSGMAPKGMEQPTRIVAAILHGLEVGMKPMQSVQSIAVVNGRPTIWGDAAIGLVEASGLLDDFAETVEGDGEAMVATCRARRKGRKSEIVGTFSAADAKRAGLWGKQGPWTQYPRRMLQLRARSFCLRDGFADVLRGLSVREEVQDYRSGAIDAQVESNTVSLDALKAEREPSPATDPEPAGGPEVGDTTRLPRRDIHLDDPALDADGLPLD